jgi:dihydropteroate synthase
VIVGISRKSMVYKALDITPEESLNGTVVLNTIATQKGVQILRVHDVKEAKEMLRLYSLTNLS